MGCAVSIPQKNAQVKEGLGVNSAMEGVVHLMRKSKEKVSNLDSLSALLLTFIALSGEFPTDQISRLPSTDAYKEKVIKSLKNNGLIRTYYRDGLRGLRLTAAAKKQMAADWPDRFSPLFTGDTMTNAPKYTISHRLCLHRMAEVLVSMLNVGVSAFPWQKPVIFTPTPLDQAPYIEWPIYFSSREVKGLGAAATKIRNSRAVGLLLTDGCIFSIYNTGSAQMKWEYQAEMRLKAMLQIELCQNRLLEQLAPTIPYDDGEYTGELALDHTTLSTVAAGYTTQRGTITATKTIGPLDRNDMSYVPATTTKNGRTLSLVNVDWQVIGADVVGDVMAPCSYQAVATYSASTSSQVATGYVTTAEYKGEVVSEGVDSITYTVVYVGSEIVPAEPESTAPVERARSSFLLPLAVIGVILLLAALAALTVFGVRLFQHRKNVYVFPHTRRKIF